jgi:hypothetical protein
MPKVWVDSCSCQINGGQLSVYGSILVQYSQKFAARAVHYQSLALLERDARHANNLFEISILFHELAKDCANRENAKVSRNQIARLAVNVAKRCSAHFMSAVSKPSVNWSNIGCNNTRASVGRPWRAKYAAKSFAVLNSQARAP